MIFFSALEKLENLKEKYTDTIFLDEVIECIRKRLKKIATTNPGWTAALLLDPQVKGHLFSCRYKRNQSKRSRLIPKPEDIQEMFDTGK